MPDHKEKSSKHKDKKEVSSTNNNNNNHDSEENEEELAEKIDLTNINKESDDDEDEKKKEEEKKKREKEERVSFAELFRYATPFDYLLIAVGSVGALLVGFAMPAFSYLFGRMIDNFNSGASLYEKIVHTAVLFLYVGIVAWVAAYAQRACWMTAAERQTKRIRQEYLKAILRQEIAWFDFIGTGELTSRVSSDTIIISEGLGEKIGTLVQHMGTFVGGFIAGFLQGWQMTLVILAISPLLAATGAFLVRVLAALSTRGQKAYSKAGGVATEVISSMRTVASLTGEQREITRYGVNLAAAAAIGRKKAFFTGLGLALTMMTWFGSYALTLWYGGILVVDHGYSGGKVLSVLFSVIIAAFAVGQAGPCMEAIGKAQGAAFKIYNTISRKPEIDASSNEGITLENVKGNIKFKKIHFEYPSRKEVKVLRGLSLKIKSGQTVALVGQSGCGKSSVVSLIQRFYDPTKGAVMVDGNDIREFNIRWWRQQIGLVGQEPVLFSGSIAENIAYGKEGATQEEIEEAAKAANAHTFVKEFPQGYDTQVGEKGAQLSGGQKQRIAIARAIIKNPKILLLDEATSALDSESEKIVQKALDNVMQGRTTIVIAHRLSTIKNADLIGVIKDGKVHQKGTHDQLMEAGGIYKDLVTVQAATSTDELSNTKAKGRSATLDLQNSLDKQASQDIIDETAKIIEKEKDVPLSRLMALNKPEIPYLCLGVLGATINGGIHPVFAIIFSRLVNIYFLPEHEIKHESAKWALFFVYLAIAAAVANLTQGYFFGFAGERLVERVRQLTFRNILKQNIGFFDDASHSTGILTSRLASDATLLESMLGTRLGLVVQNTVTLCAGLAIAFYYGWELTLVILATGPLIAFSNSMQMLAMNGFSGKTQKAVAGANQVATEAISNIRTVASFTTEDKVLQSFDKKLLDPYRMALRTAHVTGFLMGFSQFIMFASYCLAFWYGGRKIRDGDYSFLDVMTVLMAIFMGAMALGQSTAMAPDASKGKTAARAIFELIDYVPAFDSSSPDGKKIDAETFEGHIELRDVKFRYPTRPDAKVLRGLSLTVKPGQVVALVGPSGCGKSSIISLLERFYDADSGEVLMDGVPIKDINLKSLRRQIGLVGQEPVLFSGSIAENIAYGKEGASQEQIEEAAKAANAHKFITSFPNGYNTQVGEKGAQLSGGQKQRIAIARAIIKNPKILLLDEATSALDSESEKIVQKALERVMKGRTTVVVAHRLSTIKDADVIIVIDHGRIEEMGTHEELLKEGGIYYSLAARQSA